VLRHAPRLCPGRFAVAELQDDLVPVVHFVWFLLRAGHPDDKGVRLCDENDKVLPEVIQIMEMAVEKKLASASAIPTSTNFAPGQSRQ
jgi:hypothetical protein